MKIYWGNRRYTNKFLKEILQTLKVESGTISENLVEKIHFYTIQSCMVSSWTTALRGYKLSLEEKRNATILGMITPIMDDLTDNAQLSTSEIFEILKNKHIKVEGELALARYLFEQLQNLENTVLNDVIEKTLISQEKSIAQFNETRTLTFEELKEITKTKGGLATLLYRVVLSNDLKKGEEEAFMTLGYSMQQLNDMFDIHKDYKNKQQTNFTNATDMTVCAREYYETLDKCVNQFAVLDYGAKNILKCLLQISTVSSRGMVCMEQLLRLNRSGKSFHVDSFSRNQLICDMEKPSNIKRSVFYSVNFFTSAKQKLEAIT